jgi:hypothetical protein
VSAWPAGVGVQLDVHLVSARAAGGGVGAQLDVHLVGGRAAGGCVSGALTARLKCVA